MVKLTDDGRSALSAMMSQSSSVVNLTYDGRSAPPAVSNPSKLSVLKCTDDDRSTFPAVLS